MYEYAVGDLRVNTRELVRAKSPEHARRLCVALGVPEEHVLTWAVLDERVSQWREVQSAHAEAETARLMAAGAVDKADTRIEEAEIRLANEQNDRKAAEQRKESFRRAIDEACAQLYRIDLDDELGAADADRIAKALEALSAV